jgi:hypothetical protein
MKYRGDRGSALGLAWISKCTCEKQRARQDDVRKFPMIGRFEKNKIILLFGLDFAILHQ